MTDASHDDPIAPNAFTVLRLQGIGVPPYSARGLTQTLSPIDQASQYKRDVNGGLQDCSFDGFQKYRSTISGTDQQPPNLDGKWPGKIITVDCITELSFTPDESETAQRPVVPGSELVVGAHTTYRPRLTMLVTKYSSSQDEYGREINWSLELEEV